MSSDVTSAIAGAFALGLATVALAATKGEFDNMCAEGLALHKEIKTDCSVPASTRARPIASATSRPRLTS